MERCAAKFITLKNTKIGFEMPYENGLGLPAPSNMG